MYYMLQLRELSHQSLDEAHNDNMVHVGGGGVKRVNDITETRKKKKAVRSHSDIHGGSRG